MHDTRDAWSGQRGILVATIGSAVGIGSIWKFPYEVGANGGSAFVLCYLAGIALIVLPLMLAEFAIGRIGRADCAQSIRTTAAQFGVSPRWTWVGVVGVVTGFIILSYYSVVGGWTIGYAIETTARGLPGADATAVRVRFDEFLAAPVPMLGYHVLFLALLAFIVSRGITKGIEAAARMLLPLLLLLMALLAAYAALEGDLAAALRFLFQIDPARFTARAALEALGLGFFSIGVGLGLMITYAGYSPANVDLKRVAIVSVLADTAISFLAGIAVFPLVFRYGLDPASGAGLVFVTLPLAFARLPLGGIAAAAFFILLFVAALASAMSMLELVVALLMRLLRWRRSVTTWAAAAACFVLGIATVLSFNLWADWHPLAAVESLRNATIYDLTDEAMSNIMLPACGLALSLLSGWALPPHALPDALRLGPSAGRALRILLRYVAPLGIAAAVLANFIS